MQGFVYDFTILHEWLNVLVRNFKMADRKLVCR